MIIDEKGIAFAFTFQSMSTVQKHIVSFLGSARWAFEKDSREKATHQLTQNASS